LKNQQKNLKTNLGSIGCQCLKNLYKKIIKILIYKKKIEVCIQMNYKKSNKKSIKLSSLNTLKKKLKKIYCYELETAVYNL